MTPPPAPDQSGPNHSGPNQSGPNQSEPAKRAPEEKNFVLVAPAPENPFTGGHLYNARVAELLGMEVVAVPVDAIGAWLEAREAPCLLDSLYLPHAPAESLRRGPAVLALAHFLAHRASAVCDKREQILSVLRACSGVVATSAYTGRQIREDLPEARIFVCCPGVEASFAADPGGSRGRSDAQIPQLLSVANFEARKGHADALEALAALADLPWRWDIIGDLEAEPGTAASFRESLSRSGVADRVRLLGRLEPDAVRRSMHACDVFVLPTHYEPFGMVFAESVASGTPVVAYDCGGVPESVEHGVTGLLVPRGDQVALRRALREVLASREVRDRMSQSCRAKSLPTWEDTARAIESACRDVLRSG